MNSTVYNKSNKLLIPIIIILLIPMVLAVYFAMNPGAHSSIPMNTAQIKVEYANLGMSESFDSAQIIDTYQTAILSAKKITADYRDVSTEIPFIVTFVSGDNKEPKVYEFFMKYDADECIYRTADGEYYLFDEGNALKLLERAEFQSINKTATAPYVFAGSNGVALAPTSGTWNHKNADGSFAETALDGSVANSVPAKISLSNPGALTFAAASVPDSVNVTLSLGGSEKHNGPYENILNANVMSANDTVYDMVITATWEQKDGVDYHGTLIYNAQLFYDVSPTYEVAYNGSIIRGDFGVVKIKNFNDGEKLYVTSDFTLPSELQVFPSPMGYSYAFLPVEYWTQGAVGSYDVTLSLEDGSSQNVRIRVKDSATLTPAIASQTMLVNDVELAGHFTEDSFNHFYTLVAEKTAATEKYQLWEGKFVYPNSENKKNRGNGMADYGTLRTVNAAGIYNNSYYHNGVDIEMAEGESVLATNNGKVVFAGELELTGNTVIIDHGCSILSYYGHLGSISVKEGDTVSKSGVIGTAGSTGFAVVASGTTGEKKAHIHFAISMEGKFIVPHFLCKDGVLFDD